MYRTIHIPFINSVNRNYNGGFRYSTHNKFGVSRKDSNKTISKTINSHNSWVLYASLVIIGLLISMLVSHVFWVNMYAAKGFEIKDLQNNISEQSALEKKLLVEQSLLSSTANLHNFNLEGYVPIETEEYLSSNNFAQAQ